MKMTCLIIDDEPIAQGIIESYLAPFDQIILIGKCSNALEANKMILEKKIDLIFLDIEMPHLDGLSFIKSLETRPKVIITTAYREYALEGHELNVIDYLLKPISQDRFLKALNRVLTESQSTIENEKVKKFIYLKVDMKMVQVYLDEILYIQGLSNYVRIFCKERTLITYQKLSHLSEVLPSEQFMRSHRSYIVNMSKINSYTSHDLEIGKESIPIGGSHKDSMLQALSKYEA